MEPFDALNPVPLDVQVDNLRNALIGVCNALGAALPLTPDLRQLLGTILDDSASWEALRGGED